MSTSQLQLNALAGSRPRSGLRGPSPRKHAILAALVLLLLPVFTFAIYSVRGNAEDAIAGGQLTLLEPEASPRFAGLTDDNLDLPDILEITDVAAALDTEHLTGAGPTVQTGQAAREAALAAARENLAGADSPSVTFAPVVPSVPDGIAPSTITINGRPIGDNEQEIDLTPAQNLFTVARSGAPLAPAPIAGLSRSSPFGSIPAPNRSGLTPLKAYAKPYATPGASSLKTKKVALIVGGLGINAEQTRRAINLLPPEVTLSFAAQSSNLQNWINQARAKGHEVILELPMEPFNFNPASVQGSQYYLRTGVDPSVNIRNLDYLLSRAHGYFAVTNYQGERFLESGSAVDPVMAHLKASGLGFVLDTLGQNAMLNASLKLNALPSAQSRGVIDVNPDAASISQVLDALAASVASTDMALGMGFSYGQTIDAIVVWSKGLQEKQITLVPASATLELVR